MVKVSLEALHTIAHRLCDQPLYGLVHKTVQTMKVDPPSRDFDTTGWDTILFLLGSNLQLVQGNIRRSDYYAHTCAPFLSHVGFFLDQLKNSSLIEVHHVARSLQHRASWDFTLLRQLLSTHPDDYLIDSWIASPPPPVADDDDKAQWI